MYIGKYRRNNGRVLFFRTTLQYCYYHYYYRRGAVVTIIIIITLVTGSCGSRCIPNEPTRPANSLRFFFFHKKSARKIRLRKNNRNPSYPHHTIYI